METIRFKYFALRRQTELVAVICAGIVIVTAGMLLSIWIFVPSLKLFSGASMKPNTALGLLFASIALLILKRDVALLKPRKALLSRALIFASFTIGFLTSLEYLTGLNLGIDELIATDSNAMENLIAPGRMSPLAAGFLLLISLSLNFINGRAKQPASFGGLFVIPAFFLSLLALLGYLYGTETFYQVGPYIRISYQSAMCFNLLAIGIIFSRVNGPLCILTSSGIGGVIARRLLPMVILAPVLMGSVWIYVRNREIVNRQLGASLFVISIIITFAFVVNLVGKRLDRLELEQRKAEENFRALANNISALAWVANAEGNPTWYNQRWQEFSGLDFTDAIAQDWQKLIALNYLSEFRERWLRCWHSGSSFEMIFPLIGFDAKSCWFLCRITPLRNEAGEVIRWFGTNTDIDQQRRSEEELQSAIIARDEFLSIASHELKTPLTSIRLQAQTFRRHAGRNETAALSQEKVLKMVDSTINQNARLSRLVDDMLDVSRIQTGRLSLEKQKIIFCDVVRDAVETMRVHFGASRKPLPEFEAAGSTVGNWDPVRLEQVVTNLLTNAIRYGRENPVLVAVKDEGASVLLTVEDRGMGIPPEAQGRIFERYERAVDARHISGMGLGLFITNQIVRAHGGSIWVESTFGEGSTFSVRLPKEHTFSIASY